MSRHADSPTRRKLAELFGVDLRSLAVFRAALAGAMLYDVVDRSRDLVAHYTDLGVLPAETLLTMWGGGVQVSPLYHLSGSPAGVASVFVLFGAAAIALGIGWRTRWATALCWFLLAAVQVRNPFAAAMGGDKLLRVLVFWSLFLPLGARWSVDAHRAGSSGQHAPRVLSVPSAALLLQICIVYWTTGLLKSGETWRDGTALYFALQLDYWTTPLGGWLLEQRSFHAPLTYSARWFEILGPFLAFIPFGTGPLRVATILAFSFFHLSLAVFMSVGPFPLFCIVAWTAYLPSWFWDVLLPRLSRRATRRAEPDGAGLPPLTTPLVVQIAAGAVLVYVATMLAVNNGALSSVGISRVPAPVAMVGSVLRIHQRWTMFSPNPNASERWPVLHGRLADGSLVDPLRDAPVFDHKPEHLSRSFPSFRWRLYYAYLMGLSPRDAKSKLLHQRAADYFCRSWNETHPAERRLESIEVEIWSETTDSERPAERMIVSSRSCQDAGTREPRRRPQRSRPREHSSRVSGKHPSRDVLPIRFASPVT